MVICSVETGYCADPPGLSVYSVMPAEGFAFDEFPLFCSLVPKLVAGVTVYQGRQAAWCLGDAASRVSDSQAHL